MADKERICVVCRTRKPVTELIRIARIDSGDDNVKSTENITRKYIIDKRGNANGRGCHLCPACVEKAIKSKALNRSFKTKLPDEIYTELQDLVDYKSQQ